MSSAPPTSYATLSEPTGSLNFRPTPYNRTIPQYHSTNRKKKNSGRCKCICCCYCFLFLFILILSALFLYIYKFYKPQVPSYQIQNFAVQTFKFQPDFTLTTEFLVSVKADNSNENMEFIYGSLNSVTVFYNDSTLCRGSIPAFQQRPKNTTVMEVMLKGQSRFGSGLQEALMDNEKSRQVPLLVMVKVPVNVVLAGLQLPKVNALINCSLVVDHLSPNKKISILSNKCNMRFSL